MRRVMFAVVALAAAAMVGSLAVGTHAGSDSRPTRYIVLYSPNAAAAMKAAVVKAGGRVVKANNRVGVATVSSSDPRFKARARASKAIQGVARDRVIGRANPGIRKPLKRMKFSQEYLPALRKAAKGKKLTLRRKSGGFRYQGGGNRA
jgi:hypothetical protein